MIHKIFFTAWLALSCLLLDSLVFAQTEVSPAESGDAGAAAAKTNPGSQEVEYNDDNYRRFMELRDEHTQRSSLAVNANQSGPQKLDKLPEASQKHLRNQLREIILEGSAWTPGEENKEFRYVASEAAQESPALQQQEAEAWGELVGKYHQREARIYADAARSKSAAGTEGGAHGAASQAQANVGESAAEPAASDGSNSAETGGGDEKKQSGQQQQSAQASQQDSYSPASSANRGDADANSTAGVSQNAMEYLMKSEKQNSSDTRRMSESAENTSQLVVISKDTLSIKDLQNAQGITISTGTGSSQATPIDIEDDNAGGLRKGEDG